MWYLKPMSHNIVLVSQVQPSLPYPTPMPSQHANKQGEKQASPNATQSENENFHTT